MAPVIASLESHERTLAASAITPHERHFQRTIGVALRLAIETFRTFPAGR